jgi:phenylalanyl-tRNA synthetase alpha chain
MSQVSNVPDGIKSKIGMCLHNKKGHPLQIIKERIYGYLDTKTQLGFKKYDDFDSKVSVNDNFDLLLIPKNHPSRSRSDTYYITDEMVLRTHTSAHQNQLLEEGQTSFLVTGDVYRKDEIDSHHYNIFHQMEGVYLLPDHESSVDDCVKLLKSTLAGLVTYLFPGREYRFNSDYFPFTDPSFEIEVKFGEKWLEILGCGVIHPDILTRLKIKQKGFAWGLGLERLAMILFDIQDIRLFWTQDERFLEQFSVMTADSEIVQFKPFSKIKPITKDISFWIPPQEITESEDSLTKKKIFAWTQVNEFYEWVRDVCGDHVESVQVLDSFYHPKKKMHSMTFRCVIGASDANEDDHAQVTKHANLCMEAVIKEITNRGYVIR